MIYNSFYLIFLFVASFVWASYKNNITLLFEAESFTPKLIEDQQTVLSADIPFLISDLGKTFRHPSFILSSLLRMNIKLLNSDFKMISDIEKAIIALDAILPLYLNQPAPLSISMIMKEIDYVSDETKLKVINRILGMLHHWDIDENRIVIYNQPHKISILTIDVNTMKQRLYQCIGLVLSRSELKLWMSTRCEKEHLEIASYYYQFENYPEGSYNLLQILKPMYPNIELLDRGYYDPKAFINCVKSHPSPDCWIQTPNHCKFTNVVNIFLTKLAHFHEIKLTKQLPISFGPKWTHDQQCKTMLLDMDFSFNKLQVLLKNVDELPALYDHFLRIFGYFKDYGSLGSFDSMLDERDLLLESPKLSDSQSVFNTITSPLLLDILNHLYALKNPIEYKKGLEITVFGLPTMGKLLSSLPFVESLREALDTAIDIIKGPEAATETKAFLVVIDQSEQTIFDQNAQYLRTKGCDYFHIVHVSKEDAENLATKIGILPMIDSWGYGGARNAVSFLAPIIAAIFEEYGYGSIQQAIDGIDHVTWRSLLKNYVTDPKIGLRNVLFMGDDDTWIPEDKILSDLLDASIVQVKYTPKVAFRFGRSTETVDFNQPLAYIHPLFSNAAKISWISTSSSNFPGVTLMDGSLSLPRFCMPLKYPGEEHGDLVKHSRSTLLPKVTLHFCGDRFPIPEGKLYVSPLVFDSEAIMKKFQYSVVGYFERPSIMFKSYSTEEKMIDIIPCVITASRPSDEKIKEIVEDWTNKLNIENNAQEMVHGLYPLPSICTENEKLGIEFLINFHKEFDADIAISLVILSALQRPEFLTNPSKAMQFLRICKAKGRISTYLLDYFPLLLANEQQKCFKCLLDQ